MNKFKLSTNIGSDADLNINKGKFYFFSTTRSKTKQYSGRNTKIVLDGRRLSNNYKGFAIDYWNYSKNPKDWSDKQSYINSLKDGEEHEDRIISDKPYIENAKNYIKEIHVFLDKFTIERITKKYINKIYQISNNIPLYFYTNERDYLMEIKNKSVDPLTLNLKQSEENKNDEYTSSYKPRLIRVAAVLSYKDDIMKSRVVDILSDGTNKEDIIKSIDETIEKDKYNYYRIFKSENDIYKSEFITVIKSDLHNARSFNDPIITNIIKLLTDYMKKNKLKNIGEFLHFKLKGSYKYIDDYRKLYYDELITNLDNNFNMFINTYNNYRYEIYEEFYDNVFTEFQDLRNFFENIINKIKKYLEEIIFNKENEFKYLSTYLSREKIQNYLNFYNIDYNKILIINNEYIPLSQDLIDSMDYILNQLISDVDYNSYDLYKKYMEIYQNQDINESKIYKIINEEVKKITNLIKL